MRLNVIAIGQKMPSWIQEGFAAYQKRMPAHCAITLIEIPLLKRQHKNRIPKLIEKETQAMLKAIPQNNLVIALDEHGKQQSTKELSDSLQQWMQSGRDVSFLIGGPEGLSEECLKRADRKWSLSRLTYPHALVRVILAEQLYRAMTLLEGHPYHRP